MKKASNNIHNTIKKRQGLFIALAALVHSLILLFLLSRPQLIEVPLNLAQVDTQVYFNLNPVPESAPNQPEIKKETKPEEKVEEKNRVEKKKTKAIPKKSKTLAKKKANPTPKKSTAAQATPIAAKAAPKAPARDGEIEKYLRKVIFKLEKNKYYPRLAQENEEEGLLKIEIILDRSGRLKSYRFLKKTSHNRLNQAAEKTLQRAGSFGPLPSSYGGESLSLQVPIRFRLAS